MKQLIFAVLALSLLVPAVPLAHPGHDHKLMGTITSIDKNKVVVKTTEGKDMTFEITPMTTFKRGKKKGAQPISRPACASSSTSATASSR